MGRFDPVTEMRPEVDLTSLDLKRSVSRRHARLIRTDDGFTAWALLDDQIEEGAYPVLRVPAVR